MTRTTETVSSNTCSARVPNIDPAAPTDSVVRVIARWSEFYQHESCGKCTPCREGTYWMKQIMLRLERGEGRPGDVDLLDEIAHNIAGRSFCPLG